MRVLVIDPDPERGQFFVQSIVGQGIDAEIAPPSIDGRGDVDEHAISTADVVLVEVDAAVTSSWFERARTLDKPRVVLTSSIEGLLAPWRDRGVLTLRLPATPETIVDAVSGKARMPSSPLVETKTALPSRRLTQDVVGELGHLTDLVASAARTPLALVTVIDGEQQHFLLQKGLDVDLVIAGGTPKSWSFCQHVVSSDGPLVVSDARLHPILADTPLVTLGLVRSYAGMPIRSDGVVVGTVCALSPDARKFAPADLAALRLAAELVEARLRVADPRMHAAETVEILPTTKPGKAKARAAVLPATPSKTTRADETLIGEVLGERYLVTASLGSGGMSHVYLARETTLGTLVAIKLLHEGGADQALIDEARTIVNVRHPNIVQAHGWGRTTDGSFFLVLEYVRGRSLHQLVRESRAQRRWLPIKEIVAALRDVAGALESLHAVGMIHGDVKPPNVLADATLDRRVLIDFGLAMRMPQGGPSSSGSWRLGAPSTGRVGGTPGFSAPEQLAAEPPVVPAPHLDVYGLAALAYYLLLGRQPFGAALSDQGQSGSRAAVFPLPGKLRSDLPPPLDELFARALSEDARARPKTPTIFVDLFERAIANKQPARSAPLGEPTSRGEAFLRMRSVVRSLLGPEGESALVAAMPEASRRIVEAAREPDRWHPAEAYLDYLRSYARRAPLESLGAAAYRKLGPAELTSMRIDRSPHTLVRAMQPGFHRLHDWCGFDFNPIDTHSVSMTLQIPSVLAAGNTVCTLVAGWARTMLLAVRREVSVHHVKCIATSDDHCEMLCRWKD